MSERGVDRQRAVVLGDRYRLESQVASGGMGEVWRATDLVLERTVAVKLLRESLAEDPILTERFRREALTAARLSHPNMADVYDFVASDDRPGIVMEFVEGETLADRVAREGALDVAEAVRIASALLAALQVAHDAGIVHRDVKPGNVIIGPNGDVKVTDFGIARAVGHETLTETGMVVGTAHYLSPEQVNGKPATPASDLYAAGAILYEMLTGTRPFEAETPLAVAMQRLTAEPVTPRELRPDVPEPVAQAVLRAIARDPASRFGSADEMRARLGEALADGDPAPAAPTGHPKTDVLPVAGEPEAPTVVRAAVPPPAAPPDPQTPRTGSAPAAAVAERRRRDYRRAVIWAIVIAVAVAGGAWLIAAARGPGSVRVPDFKGLRIEEARISASERGLILAEELRPSNRPEGEVLSQNVAANLRLEEGQTITLFVSNGVPPCCTVPDLKDLSIEDAEAKLVDAGLMRGSVSEFPTEAVEPGTVISQTPAAGASEPEGTEVDIVVATEPDRGGGDGDGNGDGKGNDGGKGNGGGND